MVVLSLRLTLLAACGSTCGAGTHDEDGVCVADAPPDESDADTDSDADADADADTDADTDADADADADADTDTDAPCDVAADGSAPFDSIQDAIDAADDGDLVRVCPGTYTERVDLAAEVSIVGRDGSASTIIDGEYLGPVVTMLNGADSSTTFSGFTLVHGDSETGGAGLHVASSSPTIRDLVIRDCEGTAGVEFDDSRSEASGLEVTRNATSFGLYVVEGAPTLSQFEVTHNAVAASAVNLVNTDAIVSNGIVAFNEASWQYGYTIFHFSSGSAFGYNLVVAANSGPEPANSQAGRIEAGEIQNSIFAHNSMTGLMVYNTALSSYNLSAANDVCNFYLLEGSSVVCTGPGETDVESEPRFTDEEGGDWTLASISPAMNAGNPIAGYNDADGTRNDMGAYGGPGGAW